MKRWRSSRFNAAYELVEKGQNVERPDIDTFIEEIIAVCRKHGFSLSHEDGGAFMVVDGDAYCEAWLRDATDNTSEGKS